MSDTDVEAAVHSHLAQGKLQQARDYLNRGRQHEITLGTELAAAWVSLIREWSKAPELGHDPRRNDIEAEYALRGLKLPWDLVQREGELIIENAAQVFENMDQDEKDEFNSRVMSAYAEEKGRRNYSARV